MTVPDREDGTTFLLPGDLEREGWDELLKRNNPGKALDVLLAAHHGRESGETPRVIGALHPKVVVASDSDSHPEIAQSLAPGDRTAIHETAREGAVWIEVEKNGHWTVRSFFSYPQADDSFGSDISSGNHGEISKEGDGS